jgi:hypothetical protein
MRDYRGLKVCWGGNGLNEFPDVHRVQIAKGRRGEYAIDMQFDTPGIIGGGGNSGFQALNLAVQFGASRVLLIGVDMTDAAGIHWYGKNRWPMANNPARDNFQRWIEAFNRAAPVLSRMGVRVFNGSPRSALQCFPRASIAEFLKMQGSE